MTWNYLTIPHPCTVFQTQSCIAQTVRSVQTDSTAARCVIATLSDLCRLVLYVRTSAARCVIATLSDLYRLIRRLRGVSSPRCQICTDWSDGCAVCHRLAVRSVPTDPTAARCVIASLSDLYRLIRRLRRVSIATLSDCRICADWSDGYAMCQSPRCQTVVSVVSVPTDPTVAPSIATLSNHVVSVPLCWLIQIQNNSRASPGLSITYSTVIKMLTKFCLRAVSEVSEESNYFSQ